MYEVPFQDIWKRVLAIVYILFQAAHTASHCCFLQKLHWASKETYDFFIATLTKIQSINMTHNWAHISYNTSYQAHLKKKRLLE